MHTAIQKCNTFLQVVTSEPIMEDYRVKRILNSNAQQLQCSISKRRYNIIELGDFNSDRLFIDQYPFFGIFKYQQTEDLFLKRFYGNFLRLIIFNFLALVLLIMFVISDFLKQDSPRWIYYTVISFAFPMYRWFSSHYL